MDASTYSSSPRRIEVLSLDQYSRIAASHTPIVLAVFLAASLFILGPFMLMKSTAEQNEKAQSGKKNKSA